MSMLFDVEQYHATNERAFENATITNIPSTQNVPFYLQHLHLLLTQTAFEWIILLSRPGITVGNYTFHC